MLVAVLPPRIGIGILGLPTATIIVTGTPFFLPLLEVSLALPPIVFPYIIFPLFPQSVSNKGNHTTHK